MNLSNQIRQSFGKISSLVTGLALALAISLISAPTTSAHTAPLIDRVPEALTAAGLPVTPAAWQSFAAGVTSGHYASYDQLVNAMRWHKAHGRWTANTSTFKQPSHKTWTFTGTVTEVNRHRLEMTGTDKDGMVVRPKFKITENTVVKNGVLLFDVSEQTLREVTNEVRRGSTVKVWYSSSQEAWVIKNLAPVDKGDSFGPVDCGSCNIAGK